VAATSDDDPEVATAAGNDDNSDGDTTAAAQAPATKGVKSPIEDDEDRTVQEPVDPKVRSSVGEPSAPARLKGVASPPPRPAAPGPPAPPVRITSKKMTALGLGAPPPVTRPAAGFEPPPPMPPPAPPPPPPPKREESTEAEASDDSITATAPAPRVNAPPPNLPLAVPGSVKITELPEPMEGDETEVRTLVSAPAEPPPTSPAPSAPRPPSQHDAGEADEPDDSVTTQAPSPIAGGRLPGEDEPKTSPPMLAPPSPSAGRVAAVGAKPPDERKGDAYGDESVTTRGPAIGEYEDDSVTAQAPVTRGSAQLPAALQHPPTFDEADGTTKRLAKRDQVALDARADADSRSVTSEAPLANMLRVLPVPTTGLEGDPLDDSAEVRTAVMINAPPRPAGAAPSGASRVARAAVVASGPLGGGLAAIADLRSELREPASDSGLRVARAEAPSGDHASLGAIMAGTAFAPTERADRGSGVGPIESALLEAPGMNPYGNLDQASFGPPLGPQPSPREFDFAGGKKPRYGLIVGVVAVLSFAIPLLLFLWLHSNAVIETVPREPAEVAPDPVRRADTPRPKASSAKPAPNAPGPPRTPIINRRK
jgi:hypothetical protein